MSVIQGVQFRDGLVEITYSEPSEVTETMAQFRVLIFTEDDAGPSLIGVQEEIADLLDAMLVKLRNPKPLRPGKTRE